jgi:hypothetical protein
MADKKNVLQDLLAQYNAGRGGPVGQTLLSVLGQQQDPRAQHWMQWEMQRRRDANGGGVLPEDLMGQSIPMATQEVFPGGRAMTVQAIPMAPGEYEAMMQQLMQQDLLRRGRASPQGRAQGLQNASNNIGMMWDKQRINNAVMPAEVGSPGMSGRLFDLFQAAIGRKPAL